MIVAENPKPDLIQFQRLMEQTDVLLNADAAKRQDYYTQRGGKLLEKDVCDAISECAIGTPFQGTIQLVSGASFPDIVANKYYGVEVKSTEKDHWTSTGSSILESTRNQEVERIYLTFGKLGKPVQFLSRPYEACLSGIAVTHYPRYLIDMRLKDGDTIFDKMGISYDELRLLDNPVEPVSRYYKSKLKPGESLWWAAGDAETVVPPTVKLWTALEQSAKEEILIQGYTLFPELFNAKNTKKYNRFALWLATQKGVVNTNIRDSFSAGGQVLLPTVGGIEIKMPAIFGRVAKYHTLIEEMLLTAPYTLLKENWGVNEVKSNRVKQWCDLVAIEADTGVGYQTAAEILKGIFPQYLG
jgi:hypothetical protein